MTITYKTDDSFFIGIYPPFVYHGMSIKNWFIHNDIAKFRFIRDVEVENEFLNLKQVQELYPGIKTFGVVLNPWARMRQAFLTLNELKIADTNRYAINAKLLDSLELENFDKFIEQLSTIPTDENLWFSITTPLQSWISCSTSSGLLSTDYVLRGEQLEKDFKPIQEYFCTANPLNLKPNIEYKEFYKTKTKKIVAKLFEQDIDQFGYLY
jgi:hypothetical protein